MRRTNSEVFGKVPGGTTHWSVRKKGALAWEWCTYAHGGGAAQQEFPLEELSSAIVRERWGAGTYRLMFVALAHGVRNVQGSGKVFEVGSAPTPKPGPAVRGEGRPAGEAHGDMVRALLKGLQGKQTAGEMVETLAIPVGMALSALFAGQDKVHERLDAIEARLLAMEKASGASRAEPEANATRLDRLLDRLESIEGHLARGPAPRRASPSGRKTPR